MKPFVVIAGALILLLLLVAYDCGQTIDRYHTCRALNHGWFYCGISATDTQ